MHLLLLALLGAAAAAPSTELDRNTNNLEAQYYLPRETEPLFYDVSLFLNPDNDVSFDGEVSIRIEAKRSTQEIVIHAMEMVIKTVEVRRDVPAGSEVEPNIYLNHDQATDDTHFLRIRTSAALELDVTYIVKITYNSKFAENMFGVYVSTYNDPDGSAKRLITSQLQPTFARRAFPCYDEPGLKAIFRTTIYAPAAYQVVKSNMPKRQQNLKADVEGWVKHEFEDTLIMSTYLIAYLVSNFENINNEAASNSLYRVPFSILSRPGTQNNAQFALEFGQRNMLALEQYTEFEYAFPKMDKVAAPDFAAGAMENWGLVIYREVALLVTEGVTTTSTRQNVGRIICHENMHMWFGNEVGPWSWTYTWLNEGFANFFENFATDLVMPQWRMMDQYVIAVQNVFQSDAVLSVNPMTHAVYTPSQVLGTFNAVAYQKSGSVIRMMQHALTPEIFRKGLVHYIKSMSRQSARPEDLYRSLQAAVDEAKYSLPWSVAAIMDRWATQGGFPVVRCIRDAPSGNSIACRQERYLTDSSLSHNARWHIPVNWAISTNPNFDDTKPQNWIPVSPTTAHSVDIPGLNQAEWYIINKQQTGYYRVDYDVANWRALERVLFNSHVTIHLLNRAQLVDDSFNLARNGRLSYEYPLDISRYLVREMDYIPWASANAAFGYIDVVLSSTDVYDLWKKYVLELTAPQYQRLGFIRDPSEEFVTAYHRTIILNLNCRYGNENCVNQAETLLQDYREKNALPHPDIQTTVFCSGLRGGSAENFQFLWDEYLKSSDSSVQSILLNALGCTTNADSRKFYMNQVISEGSAVRDQDRHTVLVSVINSSPESMEDALDFIIENFHLIQPRVQGLTGTTNILNALARMLTSQQHSQKIQEFKNRHSSIFTAGELASIAAIEENIAASITWSNDHFSVVESWLNKYYQEGDGEEGEGGEEGEEDGEPDSANAISASFVILISAVVTFYNRQA